MEERYTPEGVQHLEKQAGKARRAALLAAAAGVLLSAAFLALIGHNPDSTGDAPQH